MYRQIQDWSLNYLLADCQLQLNPAKPFSSALSLPADCYIPFLSPSAPQTPDLHLRLHFTAIFQTALHMHQDLPGFRQTTTCTLHTPSFNTYIFSQGFSSQFLQAHPEQLHICSAPPPGLGSAQKGAPERFIVEYHAEPSLQSGCSNDPVFLDLQKRALCQQGPQSISPKSSSPGFDRPYCAICSVL